MDMFNKKPVEQIIAGRLFQSDGAFISGVSN